MNGTTGSGRYLNLALTLVLAIGVVALVASGRWPSEPGANVAIMVSAAGAAIAWPAARRRRCRPRNEQ
jgi:hypothetical protein